MGELIRIAAPDAPPTSLTRRELDYQRADGIIKRLSWLCITNELELSFTDEKENKAWVSIVPNDKGLDAMRCPWKYEPRIPDGA